MPDESDAYLQALYLKTLALVSFGIQDRPVAPAPAGGRVKSRFKPRLTFGSGSVSRKVERGTELRSHSFCAHGVLSGEQVVVSVCHG